MQIVPLKCPNCGARLDIAPDMDQFACGHCGGELHVARRGGTIALRPVVAAIERVQQGTDRTAMELELVRLEKSLEPLRAQINHLTTTTVGAFNIVPGAITAVALVFFVVRWVIGADAGFIAAVVAGIALCLAVPFALRHEDGQKEELSRLQEELDRCETRVGQLRSELTSPVRSI